MKSGSLLWIYVDVEQLDRAELRDYVTAAWRTAAPKKIANEFQREEKRL
jgi:hypothetical protein